MAATGLFGPNPLTDQIIDTVIKGVGPGAYALGHNSPDNATFFVKYVGRSDGDLAARLKNWVGQYPLFKYGFLPSAQEAFIKECNLFHDFGETALDNKVHPARPAASKWTCPRCRLLD